MLAVEAVKAGIDNDLGSGSHVDVCVIGPNGSSTPSSATAPKDRIFSLSSSTQAGGVNGFGNTPCALRSKKVIQPSPEQQKEALKQQWNTVLGCKQ